MSLLQFLSVCAVAVFLGPVLVYAVFKMAALGIFRAKRIMEQEEENGKSENHKQEEQKP